MSAPRSGRSSAAPTLSVGITASRTSGASPLAVFFEAVITGSSAPARTFHHCNVHWDYGDPSSGTWAYGNSFLNSRDEDFAPMGSHVFEGAGPFTVTCTVTAPDGETAQDTVVISPTAEDTAFAGAATTCLSNDTDHTGSPAGANLQNNVTTLTNAQLQAGLAAGFRRILFRAGDTFDIQSLYLGNGVGYGAIKIGSYGAGAQPILRRTSASTGFSLFGLGSTNESAGTGLSQAADDIRFSDVNMSNQTAGGAQSGVCVRGLGQCTNILIHNCTFGQMDNAFQVQPFNLKLSHDVDSNVDQHDGLFFHGNVSTSGGSCGNPSGRRISWKGNDMASPGGSHTVRLYHSQRWIVGHNRIGDSGASEHQLKLSSHQWEAGYDGSFTPPGPVVPGTFHDQEYHELGAVHDNEFRAVDNNWSVTLGRGNSGFTDERMRDIIVERCWFRGDSTSYLIGVTVGGQQVTIRNNLFNMTGGNNNNRYAVDVKEVETLQVVAPNEVEVYNNSVFSSDNPSGDGFQPFKFDVSVDGATCVAKNNACYAPNDGTSVMVDDETTGSAVVKSNNGSAGSNWGTNPYATNPPTAEAHFDAEVGTGNELIDAGVAVDGLFIDYTGATRPATPNQGAFE